MAENQNTNVFKHIFIGFMSSGALHILAALDFMFTKIIACIVFIPMYLMYSDTSRFVDAVIVQAMLSNFFMWCIGLAIGSYYLELKYDFYNTWPENKPGYALKNLRKILFGKRGSVLILMLLAWIYVQHLTAKKGFLQTIMENNSVCRALSGIADINAVGNDGMTLLMRAALAGNNERVRMLVDASANVNILTEYPADTDYNALMLLFYRYMPKEGFNKEKYFDIIKLLVEQGSYFNTSDFYENDLLSLIAAWGTDQYEIPAEITQYLIQNGAQFKSFSGHTYKDQEYSLYPFEVAVYFKKFKTAEIFLKMGANPAACQEKVNDLFIYSVKQNNTEFIKTFYEYISTSDFTHITDINHILNPNKIRFSEDLAYFLKVHRRYRLYSKRDHDRYDIDDNTRTALIAATENNNIEIVKFLLERGADKSIQNNIGETAYDIAVKNNFTEAAELLKN